MGGISFKGPRPPKFELKPYDGPAEELPAALTGETFRRGTDVGQVALTPAGQGLEPVRSIELNVSAQARALVRAKAGEVDLEDGSNVTDALIMGATEDGLSAAFIRQVAAIAGQEGFAIEALVSTGELEADLENGNEVVEANEVDHANPWTEDASATTTDGAVVLPNVAGIPATQDDFSRALNRMRNERIAAEGRADGRDGNDFGYQGKVKFDDATAAMAEYAASEGKQVVQARSYVEGGNMLTGRLPNGEVFALVGKDSVAATQLALGGTEEQALAAIAADYGIKPENLHAIEQPGTFHLDMGISPLGGNKVVMNDAMAAYELQAAWAREDYQRARPSEPGPLLQQWERYGQHLEEGLAIVKAEAQKRAAWEARAAEDLEAAGFEVERMAGVFPGLYPDGQPILRNMNFLNAEKGVGADGEPYAIMLGGDPRAERYVAERLAALVEGPLTLHFLDRGISDASLIDQGGISCRVKQAARAL